MSETDLVLFLVRTKLAPKKLWEIIMDFRSLKTKFQEKPLLLSKKKPLQ